MQVYTVEDRTEIETFVPSAVHKCRFYKQAPSAYSDLKEKMEALLSKVVLRRIISFLHKVC